MARGKMIHPLAKLRDIAKLTQSELANLLGIHPVYVSRLELKRDPLPLSLAERISDLTGISPDWLLGEDMKNPKTIYDEEFTHETYDLHRSVFTQSDEAQDKMLNESYQELMNEIQGAKVAFTEAKRKGLLARIFKKTAFEFRQTKNQESNRHNYAATNKMSRAVKEANSQFFSKHSESGESSDSSSQKSKPKKPSKSKRPSPKKKRKA